MPALPSPRRLDLVAAALLAAGAACLATGLLPRADAAHVLGRTWPLLLFVAGAVVLAELTAEAGVFDVVAVAVARAGRGSYALLFGLCVAFASVVTATLNLDTTAVLLTPVMLALAAQVGIAPVPLAMTTVWLANTASLLLPVSNLTNLLAQDRLGLHPIAFAGRMWAPALAAIAVTAACLWAFWWRRGARGADRYDPPAPHAVPDRQLFAVATLVVVAFVAGVLLLEDAIWLPAVAGAAVLVAAFAVRRPAALRPALVPWRLLVLVTGLFLVVETLGRLGLTDAMAALVGGDSPWRAAFAGTGLANLVNNLPAYLAAESTVRDTDQLLALVIGVNAGPVVTPWASLATLLWYERCRARGVDVPVARFAVTGAVLAVTAVPAAVAALLLTS